jgi:uncharacterized protein YcbX
MGIDFAGGRGHPLILVKDRDPMMPSLAAISRYPVKGLSEEPLDSLALEAGAYMPGDRLYAIENGPSGYDPDKPEHMSKFKFIVLAKFAKLAALKTGFDHESQSLTIHHGAESLTARLDEEAGRAKVAAFFDRFLEGQLDGPAKVLKSAPGFRFTDSSRGYVSLINAASLRELSQAVAYPVEPVRFRGNLLIEGWEPWAELDRVGQVIAIGGVRLEIIKRTVRCPATTVNPQTAIADLMVPVEIKRHYGHADCGVYARVITGGAISVGDAVAIV